MPLHIMAIVDCFPFRSTPLFFQTPDVVAEVLDYVPADDLRTCTKLSRCMRAVAVRKVHKRVTLPSIVDASSRSIIEESTTAVELKTHDHAHCAEASRIDFRQLRTLIFNNEVVEDHPGQGPAKDNYGFPVDFGHFACGEANCVSRSLSPRRAVVRPFTTAAKDKSVFFVPPTECDTTVHLRRQGPYRYKPDVTALSTPRNITIVLLPSFYGQFKSFVAASDSESGSKSQINDSLIRNCLTPYLLANPQNKVTIVGLEDANPFASQLHWSERQMRGAEEEMLFRGYLNRLMTGTQSMPDGTCSEDWDEVARKQRQSTIRVRTTREYFEDGTWGEEFSAEVVGLWLNAYAAREEEEKRAEAFRAEVNASPIISRRSSSFSLPPSRSTTRTHSPSGSFSGSPTTLSIMADIAAKTRVLLDQGRRISLDGCVA